MRREESIDPDELKRPEGNDLQSNYEKHDSAEELVKDTLAKRGMVAQNWGIDMRDDDGDGVIFDDKMDLKVFTLTDVLLGIVEVKRKTSDYYMLKINRRHWRHYVEIAAEHDVPVFICFVDPDMEMHWVRVDETLVVDTFAFPDGNEGVELLVTHTTEEALNALAQA